MMLISMTDFVLETIQWKKEYHKIEKDADFVRYNSLERIENYAKFLKQPLELGMFVPCDEDGNVLEKPLENESLSSLDAGSRIQYQKAKERVLFKGVTVESDMYKQTKRTFWNLGNKRIALKLEFYSGRVEFEFCLYDMKVEDIVSLNFELTESAIKQLGL